MRPTRKIVFAFIALALIEGVVPTFTSQPFYSAMNGQRLAGSALTSLLAGMIFVLSAAVRRQLPGRREWMVLLVLLLPTWLVLSLDARYVSSVPWLHPASWGTVFLLTIAAPLWLALLAAMRLSPVEVPQAVAAAGIAGIGAVCLVIPAEAIAVSADQITMLLLHLLVNIGVVFTWIYAGPRIASAGTVAIAGCYLLLSGVGSAACSFALERSTWAPVDWRETLVPLLLQAAVTAVSAWLWFWLLQHMALPGFAMLPLAAWAASALGSSLRIFAYRSFLSWRADAALAIAVGAIMVALRVRVTDEQPVMLGLDAR